jgi:phenylpyruvate tautomerase PptA (4-oxalocrotonate tautomerase family)
MPVITFDGPPMDPDIKESMIKALTDAVVSVRPGIPRSAYYVYINEHPRDCIGVCGYPLDEYLQRREDGTLEE